MLPMIKQSMAILATQQQGFDPLRTLAQILCVQSLHYLTLAIVVPPLLRFFPGTSQGALSFEGGAYQIGLIIDWREMAGRPTWDWDPVDRPAVSWSTERKRVQQLYANATTEDKAAMTAWQVGSVWLDDDVHEHSDAGKAKAGVKLPLVLKHEQIVRQDAEAGATKKQGRRQNEGRTQRRQQARAGQADAAAVHDKEARLERWEWEHTRDSNRGWAIAFGWVLSAFAE